MCDFGTESYDLYDERFPCGRKSYTCVTCGDVIHKGERHMKTNGLFEGQWHTARLHLTCCAITKYIAFDVCGQELWTPEGEHTLRENVRQHYPEAPKVLGMYRDHLRARRMAEAAYGSSNTGPSAT